MAEVALAVEVRTESGTGPTRRLRKSGRIPAVLYGHSSEPISLSVDGKALRQALSTDHGLNALLALNINGKKQLAFTRDVQWHPVRRTVTHVDFLVVRRGESVTAEVPINFVGEAEQVTKQGGVVEHQLTSLTVTAPATDFPGHIDFDISSLELDGALRVGDIKLPGNVTTEIDAEEAVVVARLSRAAIEVEQADAATAEAASAESSETASTESEGGDEAASEESSAG